MRFGLSQKRNSKALQKKYGQLVLAQMVNGSPQVTLGLLRRATSFTTSTSASSYGTSKPDSSCSPWTNLGLKSMELPLALTIVYLPARELTESSSFGLSKQVAWSEAFLNRQVTTEDDNQDERDAEQIVGRESRCIGRAYSST